MGRVRGVEPPSKAPQAFILTDILERPAVKPIVRHPPLENDVTSSALKNFG